MASFAYTHRLVLFFALCYYTSEAALYSQSNSHQQQIQFKYHDGILPTGKMWVNLVWYGKFDPSERAIVADFISSLSAKTTSEPSVATWWKTTEKYYTAINPGKPASLVLSLGNQITDEGQDNLSMGKVLTDQQIKQLAATGAQKHAIIVVLTAADVTVDGFCESRCGTHGYYRAAGVNGKKYRFPYIWVGNPVSQCPGECAWPFAKPPYGPQGPPLVAPHNNVGMDGLLITLAGLLFETATNTYGNGFFQGPANDPVEAASACTGQFGVGSYPGFPGNLKVDPTTGASFNAYGINGNKCLLPSVVNPQTGQCSTLV